MKDTLDPVRKHGEERVPLAVRVFEVCFWSLMPCAEAQGSLLIPKGEANALQETLENSQQEGSRSQ